MACAKALDQDFVDKGFRRQRRHERVEMQCVENVDTEMFEEASLGAKRRQAKARSIRLEIFLRVRFEDEDAELWRQRLRARDQCLMAPMHAVEIADDNSRAARRRGQILV